MKEAKLDAGKLEIDLVPMQIVKDIAEIRMYGNKKYGDPNNWKTVEMRRYVNALLRHMTAFVEDNDSVDDESGLPHYKHMACNIAFICEMMKRRMGKLEYFQKCIHCINDPPRACGNCPYLEGDKCVAPAGVKIVSHLGEGGTYGTVCGTAAEAQRD